ncbi:MAG TPA: zf-HC2 domain-containing protein [Thermoanaerobaculia bacterium]|nr:zf-HC2 domain-containing protein [Thermoanaerobaculia bacterium]
MDEHLTADDLRDLRARAMDAAALLRATRHIAGCAVCAASLRGGIDARQAAASLRAELSADRHLDAGEELFPYADGSLNLATRAAVEEHLGNCVRCREDLDDLRADRRARSRPRRLAVWGGLAAAAATIAVILLMLTEPPPSHPVSVPVSPFAPIVRSALQAGRLDPPPALVALRRESDTLRGPEPAQHAHLEPAGVVVTTTRPRFVWTAPPGRAIVSVYMTNNDGNRDRSTIIARSNVLTTSEWIPETPLPRGRRYAWEVELQSSGVHRIIPSPPDPPALFAIVDEKTWNEIESAHHDGDHLAAAVLEARAGAKADALSDFDSYLTTHPGDGKIRALAASVRAW